MGMTNILLDGSTALRSQLAGVPDEAWRLFVHALTIGTDGVPRAFGARTWSGGYGCFDLRPKRLADLGLMKNVRHDNSTGRVVVLGDFIRPMTEQKFLQSPLAQYNALLESLRRYDRELLVLPPNMTRSGGLALLHRLGPQAQKKWEKHKESGTIALYERANRLF